MMPAIIRAVLNLTKTMLSTMDERKKRQRPSKAEKQARRVQRPQRVEPESRFDDLIKELRMPAPTKNTPAIVKDGEGENQHKRKTSHDATEKDPNRKTLGKSSDENYLRMTLYMRKEIHRRFKTKSTALDLELSEVLERLVIEWLEIDNIDDPFLKHFSVPREEG